MEQKSIAPLTSLIGSRICHDLISPIGAITNGLELLEMAGTGHGPELSLIGESVQNAAARIRFFRVAYGIAGTEALARGEVAGILHGIDNGGRVRLHWDVAGDTPRKEVRLAFLALQCLETALAYGGTIRLSKTQGHWLVIGTAPRLKLDPELWADLSRPIKSVEITPALVQFALLPDVAAEAGRSLNVTLGRDEIAISF
ncbi:histidine phosphotransferase family protein [Aestuariivita sp.]|uniref:histidine phosphotransferase family protein n=1 Tax=Aestuariivita sp. TaxID=1872407 RepID=UPI002172DEB7|nr:histidine phosphotransferase family protein [Aestuariivita sp.]MCE8005713.1 histidine phosphotransferase [Aestuariivita sp.]